MEVAVIGAGHAGKHHAHAWSGQTGFKLVGVCDLVLEKATEVAQKYGCQAYATVEALLKDYPNLAVVSVATRETHRDLLLDLLQARKQVFVEKPLVALNGQYDVREDDLRFAERVMAAWEEAGTALGINFNYRRFAHCRKLKAVLDEGRLGDLAGVSAWANLNCWSHVIDLLRWYMGDVAQISATDPHSVALQFASGASGTLWGTLSTGWQHPLLRIEIFGRKGRAVLTDLLGDVELLWSDPPERERWQVVRDNRWEMYDRSFVDSISAFAEAVQEGRPVPVSGLDAYRELQIDAGCWVSARTGTAYRVDLRPRGPLG